MESVQKPERGYRRLGTGEKEGPELSTVTSSRVDQRNGGPRGRSQEDGRTDVPIKGFYV